MPCIYAGKTWYLDCCINGTRYQRRLGKGVTRSVALELAQVQRAEILKGEAGIGKKKKDLSFNDARQHFEKWTEVNKKPRTVKSYKECLRRLAESFNTKRLSDISPFLIERHKQTRIQNGAKVRCNREIAVLKNLFNYCRAQKLYEGGNPVEEVKLLKEPKRRLRFLEPEEEQQLIDAATSPLKELIIIGINCGLRIEAEALPMRWYDVDFRRKFLTVQAAYAKNGTTRSIPLNQRALDALIELKQRGKGEIVFGKPNGQPYNSMEKPFTALVRQAGLAGTGVSLHTLRHTFASRLVQAGVDLRTVQELGDGRISPRISPWCSAMPMSAPAAFHNTALLPVKETGCA
jgi:integrase